MDFYAILGNPVEHSRSPWIHARFAQLTGQTLRYDKCLVEQGQFAASVQAMLQHNHPLVGPDGPLRLRGCNVTVPFKFEAAALATQRSARVELAQASNVLSFQADGSIHADNTDGQGLVNDIVQNAGVPLRGRAILLMGAGGAAAGVLGPLLQAGPRALVLCNRTLAKAHVLAQRHQSLAAHYNVALTVVATESLLAHAQAFEVVINATASSLAGAAVPVPAPLLRPGALVYDMMYGAAADPFLQWARAHGAVARDGLGMLVEQAALAFDIWRGVRPPAAQVLSELAEMMARPVASLAKPG